MTTVDFKAEVEKRRDEMMADLYSLLEINSERDDSKADAEHPFGPGPVKALEKFLEIAKRDGYETKNVDNYAGHFTFGEGEEELGIFALQVVAGKRTHINQKLSMASSMRVVRLMIKGLQWPATMV